MNDKVNPLLRLGTSSFTADGWDNSFYPNGTQSRDYLSYYTTQYGGYAPDTLRLFEKLMEKK